MSERQQYVDTDLYQKSIDQLLEQIEKRDQKIASKDALLRHMQAQLVARENQLARKEDQVNEIMASQTWKTALLLQRLHTFLLPANSHRSRILARWLKTFVSPVAKRKT